MDPPQSFQFSRYKVELDQDRIAVESNGKSKQIALRDVAFVFASGSNASAFSVSFLDAEKREVQFAAVLRKTETDSDRARSFMSAAAACLTALGEAQPSLEVDLGASPGTRNLLTSILGCICAVTVAILVASWEDIGTTRFLAYLAGLALMTGVFMYFYWLRPRRRAPILKVADQFRSRRPVL